MKVIWAHQPMPTSVRRSLFLAGPSPRSAAHRGWRPAALAALAARGYDDVVYLPLPVDGVFPSYDAQVEWERDALDRSDCILFWVPRDLKTLPGFTTNIEWGRYEDGGRVVLGYPADAPKMKYLDHHARLWGVPVHHALGAAIDACIERLGAGAQRRGTECQVPLDIWQAASFQGWYRSQIAAGNRLDGARPRWTFRVGDRRQHLVFWALQVDVHVAAEARNKRNEVVFGRLDTVAVVLFTREVEPRVVLVREFRAPARTRDGFVRELPGGSSFDPSASLIEVAAEELAEEVGLSLDPARLRPLATRQMAATLSAHVNTLFAAELSAAEMDTLAADERPHGHPASSEITWIEVHTLGALMSAEDVDWACVGMVLTALGYRP